MQEDNKKNTEDLDDDDLLEDGDDFDFDDIEDESGDDGADESDIDLGDDSWDDFDDTPDAEVVENKSPEKKAKKNTKAAPAEKPAAEKKAKSSGFKKSNLIIVGAAVVLGGGALVFTQMGSAPQNQAPVEQPPSDITAGMTPQPDSALPDTDVAGEQVADDVFAGPDELEGQEPVPPDEQVSVDIDGAPPMPSPMSAPSAGTETPAPTGNEVLTPMPDAEALSEEQQLASIDQPLEEEAATDELLESEAQPQTDQSEEPALMALDPSQPPSPPAPEAELGQAPVEEEAPAAPSEEAIQTETTTAPDQEQAERIESMTAEIGTLESKLAEANDALAHKAEEADRKIAELNDTIAALEKRLAAAESQQESASADSTPEAVVAEPPPKPKKSSAPAQAKSGSSTKWQLRSAQPGKALISESGSSDFRTVVVGDTLRGLGKIVSIDIEDGKWVVTGTQGRILQ